MNSTFTTMIVPVITFFLSIVGPMALAGYAIFRLKSTHPIREKVWSLFVGDKDFHDERLKSFAEEQLDLTHFRIVYGVQAKSTSDLYRLLSWMKRYKVSPEDVKRVRGWINPSQTYALNVPNNFYILSRFIGIVIIASAISWASSLSRWESTLVTMKTSGTWFLANKTSVRSILGHWRIDAQTCKTQAMPSTSETGLTLTEEMELCEGLANGKLGAAISSSVRFQRWILTAAALLVLLISIPMGYHLGLAIRAKRLDRKLRLKKNGPEKPMPTPANIPHA
ncbi:DUF6216 family protein [Burkholderia gladioli]|uniref:DUF6216 family protein n=1 Tax=Burkholderia gladioli TaxID=28095 RepID=UPI001C26164D|nr:DUF6216 family protein [Burkholderia gladioli]MBU9384911.1 hypothetical protein [Burkholderia gladioli]